MPRNAYSKNNPQPDDYNLALTDAGKLVEMSNGTASTLTIPKNADIEANEVTVNSAPGLNLTGKRSGVYLIKQATDTWVVVGDLTA